MKRQAFWLLVVLMGFSACRGQEGPAGKDAEKYICEYDILPHKWRQGEEEGDNYFFHYWFHEVSIPQLTEAVFTHGYVGCYLLQEVRYENGRTSLIQRPLPYTIYGIADDDFAYSENYSFEIRRGFINFIVKYSDFSDLQPLACTFRVVLIW